jgi:hypothetical protein
MSGGDEDLKSFRIDPFMGGPMGAPAIAPAAPAAAPAPGKAAAKSSGYLTFEAVLDDKSRFDALVASAEKTMKTLEEVARTGSAADKSDARKALMAFDHAMDLLKKGVEEVARIRKERAEQAKQRAQQAGLRK